MDKSFLLVLLLVHSVIAPTPNKLNHSLDPLTVILMQVGLGPGAAPTRPDVKSIDAQEEVINATATK
jgi:hypothetical protein